MILTWFLSRSILYPHPSQFHMFIHVCMHAGMFRYSYNIVSHLICSYARGWSIHWSIADLQGYMLKENTLLQKLSIINSSSVSGVRS